MTLSIVSVEGSSDSRLKKRTKGCFSKKRGSLKKLPETFICDDMGITVMLLKRGIIFSSYKKVPEQKEFVQKCINEIFKNNIVSVNCEESCDWIEDVSDIEIHKNKNIG